MSFILDTGSSDCLIDASEIVVLGLAPIDVGRIATATTGQDGETCEIYAVHLAIGRPQQRNVRRFDPIAISARTFINHPYDGLLGRNVLNQLRFSWDGPAGKVRLSYP